MQALIVVFDLDGTLVDTAPDLIDALNAVFTREGLPPVPVPQARNMIGGGARRMIELALPLQRRGYQPAEVDRLFENFIAHYSAHIADRSQPFPGLGAVLDELAAQGCRFAVCTNKLEGLSRRLLDALGLSSRFAAICGPDTFSVQKPHPEILHRTIERTGGNTANAVMVGDSRTDIDTARAAGVPVIAVDFGYTDAPMAQLGPDTIIPHFKDLPEAIRSILANRKGA